MTPDYDSPVAPNCPISCSFLLRLITVLVLALAPLTGSRVAQAQVARVAAAQRIIETRTGDAGAWRKSRVGAALNVDDRLRTGKRSKADLKFSDGSLLRLGQLSSVEIRGTKNVALTGGQVLFSLIRPGTRIVAGAAAAEIKGSSGIITLRRDGTAEYLLFIGAMDVVSIRGPRVPVPPGFLVTVSVEGVISTPRRAPGLAFSTTPRRPYLSTPPQPGTFVGSDSDILVRTAPGRLMNTPALEALLLTDPNIMRGNPLVVAGAGGRIGPPFPIPFPPVPGIPPGPLPVGRRSNNPPRRPTPLTTLASRRSTQDTVLIPIVRKSTGVATEASSGTRVAQQLPEDTLPAGAILDDAAELNNLDLTEAYRHLDEAYGGEGEVSGGDINVGGALGNRGLRAYGGRVHAFSAAGPWHIDVAAQSIRARSGNAANPDLDLTAISNAAVTYRNRHGDIELGRQRFQEGPVQATLFGSLVRQGTREIMDAARIRPNVGKHNRLELAYLFDAFPNNLPYRINGRQKGIYGRFATQGRMGSVGVNALKYHNLPIPNSVGATVDFAVPLLRNKIELYGEVGRDNFRRRLTTAGLAFPGLYDRTNFDVFLEYANLRSSSLAVRPPTELTLRVYRRINDNANAIASVSRFYGSGSRVIIGVAFGGGTATHQDLP